MANEDKPAGHLLVCRGSESSYHSGIRSGPKERCETECERSWNARAAELELDTSHGSGHPGCPKSTRPHEGGNKRQAMFEY